jgi:DNA polymerase III subunit delta'
VAIETLINEQGALPLPWLREPLAQALAGQRGHALLLQASPGIGALEFALCLAQSRLCEAPVQGLACGHCASCKLVRNHGHPDLFVLLPEILRREQGWPLAHDKGDAGEEGKRKPSRQIRIDDVRAVLDWVTKTSSRGQGKAVVLHPAEALNDHAASALLKTVEEPPVGTRLILTCTDPQRLLPTIRSRCQLLSLPVPTPEQAAAWLAERQVARPQVLLAACDGQPLQALVWAETGVNADAWEQLPAAIQQGRANALAGWSVPRAIDALFKLCHDRMALAAGGPPRYFSAAALGNRHATDWARLSAWQAQLRRLAQAADHPWHEVLTVEALVASAYQTLGKDTLTA